MDNLKRRHIAHPEELLNNTAVDEPTYERISLQDDEDVYAEKLKAQRQRGYRQKYVAWTIQNTHVIVPTVLTLLAFWTRFRDIDRSHKVVWDEAHFGKFGSYYLKHEFYFDVHPPLGKMLVALSGWLAGYDGSFSFESGKEYPENVNFAAMRIFNAFWGALIIPMAYATSRQLGMSMAASTLAAAMVLCDTAYLCISRFILLDSMLLFFTCASLYCLAGIRKARHSPFSKAWWFWLTMTGVSLGCVSSVKWVGLFAVALVGLYTIEELWDLFGDLKLPKLAYLEHWIARGVALIAIPAIIYMASFFAHFTVLNKSGPGDAQMSSLFQAQLEGNELAENPIEIAFGSSVTLKNNAFGGGLLHSHVQRYPEGSMQQQVTCYHHKDGNNDWMFTQPDPNNKQAEDDQAAVEYIGDGQEVRLVHKNTKRKLHSHAIPAPVTVDQFEVSGYGDESVVDIKDTWRIEIVDDIADSHASKDRVRALSTRFRIRHVHLNCLLAAHNTLLPAWGFKQIEVVCDRDAKDDDPHAWWNVEEHQNEKLPPAPKSARRSKFFNDFVHLNAAMWRSNNALIPDPDKDDKLASAPSQWPLVSIGLRMCSWSDENVKYFLLGNPVVWWSSFASLWVFGVAAGVYNVQMRRQYCELSANQWDKFVSVGKMLFLGWFLHYIPFFIMGRVTYLHHYFPALYFSILMVPFLMDHFTQRATPRRRQMVFTIAFTAVILTFVYFSPFAFGMRGPASEYSGRQWFKAWTITEAL
ncbi:glycosyltransferase family 39 protein [Zychaea mexicana]|uniref:glycosyltransferase family 39 protein n=1 Tax=Zychaea mexicana TaxID=64656 RepID=UPI0022FEE5BD|nr:glycosyltransferase family 39 protein [Zychaea mexicana]KAI9488653.1 glycosyltransferase family 39 protein [Zychaea mexicana]